MTRLFGVIGHPIGHSLSPAMHRAALAAMRLDARYDPYDVPPEFLPPMLEALMLAGVEGLNVTVPLKEAVRPLLDRLDPPAAAIGAVNTIVARRRRLIGFNTDGVGFRQALRELGWRPRPATALVLGAGGAARAVAWELARVRGSRVILANRTGARARRLASWLTRRLPGADVVVSPWRRAPAEAADLIVNATSVGMRPSDPPPVEPRRVRPGTLVYDLVYHRTTALVRETRRRGCIAADGRSMLLYQGAESLRLWLGVRPPVAPMRRALEGLLPRG